MEKITKVKVVLENPGDENTRRRILIQDKHDAGEWHDITDRCAAKVRGVLTRAENFFETDEPYRVRVTYRNIRDEENAVIGFLVTGIYKVERVSDALREIFD